MRLPTRHALALGVSILASLTATASTEPAERRARMTGEAGTAAAPQPARPNILLVYADDLGWRDVGYQGSDFHETPNIDRLAREGMRFSHAYAGAGNCAPSRAVLLSGQYTPRHGVYAVGSTDRGPEDLMRLAPVPNRSGLAATLPTVADALRSAGYRTGLFGKAPRLVESDRRAAPRHALRSSDAAVIL
jgi:hypothetical protein